MEKLSIILHIILNIFKHAKKQPLIAFLLVLIMVVTFKTEASLILQYLGIEKYSMVPPIVQQAELDEIMKYTGANVAAVYSFNYVVPQTMSRVSYVSSNVSIHHLPSKDIPIKPYAEMIVSLYSDECYSGHVFSESGFAEYIEQGIKFVVACPITNKDRALTGFSVLMFCAEPFRFSESMSSLTKFNEQKIK